MNSTQIREIVAWIRAHPEHIYESSGETFEDDTPAEAWARFCRDPTLINEYEIPEDCEMDAEIMVDGSGCDYIFKSGAYKGAQCDAALEHGEKRCKFHQAFIFSDELRKYISDQHAEINKPKPLTVIQITPGLYYETEYKLAIRNGPTGSVCIGYFTKAVEHKPIEPRPGCVMIGGGSYIYPTPQDVAELTPELRVKCQAMGLSC